MCELCYSIMADLVNPWGMKAKELAHCFHHPAGGPLREPWSRTMLMLRVSQGHPTVSCQRHPQGLASWTQPGW